MEYRVVYDVSQELPALWIVGAGLFFVAVSLAVWKTRHRWAFLWHWPARTRPWLRTLSAGFMVGFSLLWSSIATISIAGGHLRSRWALRDGTAHVIEGTVQDFVPMPYGGHQHERFSVNRVRFEYSDYSVNGGFNHTTSHGGPIHAGLPVRIHYRDSSNGPVIVKLEVGAIPACGLGSDGNVP